MSGGLSVAAWASSGIDRERAVAEREAGAFERLVDNDVCRLPAGIDDRYNITSR